MKGKIGKFIAEAAAVFVGNVAYAAAVVFVVEPSGIITGGGTGIALFLEHTLGWQLSISLFAINALMFLLGWIFLGRHFALGTAASTLLIPGAVAVFEWIGQGYELTHDILLGAVFGGILIGVSLGLVMRVGYSTGGMDIPPLIMHKYWKVPVGAAMWGVDLLILLLQAVTVTTDIVLYGIVMVMIYSFVLDQVTVMGTGKVQVQVISPAAQTIRAEILSAVDRGVTMLHGKTGFLGEETEVLITVISKRELRAVERLIHNVDPSAFLTVTRVSAVSGRGFSLGKEHLGEAIVSFEVD